MTFDDLYPPGEDNPEFRALKESRKLYKRGDKTQLLPMLYHYISGEKPIPDWLREEFRNACHAAFLHQVKSWDDVFGRPLKKGKRLATERRNAKIAWQIFECVRVRAKAGKPIDKELFIAVGKDFGISGTVASDMYYRTKKHCEDYFGHKYQEGDEYLW